MKREILCIKCHNSTPYRFVPGGGSEFIEMGKALRDFLCDRCNKHIEKGEVCCTRSHWQTSQSIPYFEWESEFIEVEKK